MYRVGLTIRLGSADWPRLQDRVSWLTTLNIAHLPITHLEVYNHIFRPPANGVKFNSHSALVKSDSRDIAKIFPV